MIKKPETEILIGYVNSFKFNDKVSEEILNGHPMEGRLYQLVKDDFYGYRLHIGAENTKDRLMAGILLGPEISGAHGDKWEFDIAIVNKDNFLDFSIHEDDIEKLHKWFDNGNQELKESLSKPTKIVSASAAGKIQDHPEMDEEDDIENEIVKVVEAHHQYPVADISHALNTIMDSDPEFFDSLASLIIYLGNNFRDIDARKNPALNSTNFILESKTKDAALYGCIAALENYNQDNNIPTQIHELHRAIDYLLVEIQRTQKI